MLPTVARANKPRAGAGALVLLGLLVCAVAFGFSCGDNHGGPLAMGSGDPALPHPASTSASTSPESASLAVVDSAIQDLDWCNIAFNAPTTMRYSRVQTVELVLSSSLPIPDLQSQLEAQTGIQSAQVQISNRMEAKLTGSGFDSEAMRPDLQTITSEQVTRWV
jgi:hypothetical protein